jgi:hypothetical protein
MDGSHRARCKGYFSTSLENGWSLICINSRFGILIMNFNEMAKNALVSTGYNKQETIFTLVTQFNKTFLS